MVIISEYYLVRKGNSDLFYVCGGTVSDCPFCDGKLKSIGSRQRKLRQRDGTVRTLIIRRLRCQDCHHIHHELPDIVVPYKRYDTETVEHVICSSLENNNLRPYFPCEFSIAFRLVPWFLHVLNHFSELGENRRRDILHLLQIKSFSINSFITLAEGWMKKLYIFGRVIPVSHSGVSDVLELIQGILCAPALERDGSLIGKKVGIYQGASFSPILSNIYLLNLDLKIQEEVLFYIRYSDDMLLFFETSEQAETYKVCLGQYLEELELAISPDKTEIVKISDGFDYLGFHFDHKGMIVPAKAKNQLGERLEEVWMDTTFSTFEKRVQKAVEIVNGWDQYFSEHTVSSDSTLGLTGNSAFSESADPAEETVSGILEFAVRIYLMQKKKSIMHSDAVPLSEGAESALPFAL